MRVCLCGCLCVFLFVCVCACVLPYMLHCVRYCLRELTGTFMGTFLVAIEITFTRTDDVETKAHIWHLFSEQVERPKVSQRGIKQRVTTVMVIFLPVCKLSTQHGYYHNNSPNSSNPVQVAPTRINSSQ